ncbi:MAG: hypothetical protein AB8G16_14880 [Gammaproteobacteria bacterium]
MKLISRSLVCVAGFALSGLSAHAASISLVPTSATTALSAGDIVDFDVVMDFSTNDSGLGSDITLGGGFDLLWDPAAMTFHGLTLSGIDENDFAPGDPDIFPGLAFNWSFGVFGGISGPALVGTISFEVLAGAPATSMISGRGTDGIGGPFVSALDFVTLLDVNYNAVEITTVPVPAALWFMLGGLGALLRLGRARGAD